MASFLYPRTVSVRRPNPNAATAGAQGYSGENSGTGTTVGTESVVATGLAASIQHRSGSGQPPGNLPADAAKRADWHIFIRTPALGTVTERDIIADDLGKRYQVMAAYWNSFGYRIYAELLQI